jgi:hypothetical protein
MPLAQGSTYQVYVPSIDYFTDKILNDEYFSYAKLSIEWWMLLNKSFKRNNLKVADFKNGIPLNLLQPIAKGMVDEWNETQRMHRKYKADVDVVRRILRMSIDQKPDNFLLAVTDRSHVTDFTFPLPKRGDSVEKMLKAVLPVNEIPLHALTFRIWAVTGTIHKFITKIKHKNIVVVGPKHLSNFGYKLGLKHFNFVEIHSTDAILHVNETKKKIQELHPKFLKGHSDVTYFFVGGGAAMWLVTELHGSLEKANLIDIGRSFDVYYFYDPVMKQYPNWMFGQWLNRKNTAWILNSFTSDKNGVYKIV